MNEKQQSKNIVFPRKYLYNKEFLDTINQVFTMVYKDPKMTYSIFKLNKKIKEIRDETEKLRILQAKAMCKKDDKNQPIIKDNSFVFENPTEWEKWASTFMNENVEIPRYKINLKDLLESTIENTLSPTDLLILESIFDDEKKEIKAVPINSKQNVD